MGKLTGEEFQVMVEAVDAMRRIEKQLAHVVAEVERVSSEVFVIGGRLIDSNINYEGEHRDRAKPSTGQGRNRV